MTRKIILIFAPILLLACGFSRSAMFVTPEPLPSPTVAQVEIPTTSPPPPPPPPQSGFPRPPRLPRAGVDGVVSGWLKEGQVIRILNDQPAGNWIHIQADDLTGWINSNYCTEAQ